MVSRLLPPNHLIPSRKLLLIQFSGWDVVCLCIHWVVQNTKQHPFLIHAGSVDTICVLLVRTLPYIFLSKIGMTLREDRAMITMGFCS
jgi:hypothetical protein